MTRSKEQREDDPLQVVLEAILKVHNPNSRDKVSLARIREEARNLARERELDVDELTSRHTAELVRSLQFKTVKWNVGLMAIIDGPTLEMQTKRFGLNGPKPKSGDEVTQVGRE